MKSIVSLLAELGPSRSSKIVQILEETGGYSPANARQIVSRSGGKVFKFPVSLLPNRETFIYLPDQRGTEEFWTNFLTALRETNSIYGMAIDGLIARGGAVRVEEFAVVSGAPVALKNQVSSEYVARSLEAANVIKKHTINGEDYFVISQYQITVPELSSLKPRAIAEDLMLDALREWSRKMGFASYNKITVRRDDPTKRRVGPFQWDMTGPSYLLPLRGKDKRPGFLVADVFSDKTLDEYAIRYIIRKVQLLRASLKDTRFLPMLVADSFTGSALTKGRSEGIILATPENLFGTMVARGLKNLIETLKNAAAIAAANPDRILKLIEQLKDIEGAASNLRGVLFELIAAYLAKIQGGSIDIGITAKDDETGKTADIDVLRIASKGECIAIECKGKNPGGIVALEEVEEWLRRIPIFLAHLKNEKRFTESKISFEIWTTGNFSEDAQKELEKQKKARTKNPIDWKDGNQVFNISKTAKEKTINKALREHYLAHPLSK